MTIPVSPDVAERAGYRAVLTGAIASLPLAVCDRCGSVVVCTAECLAAHDGFHFSANIAMPFGGFLAGAGPIRPMPPSPHGQSTGEAP